MVEGRCRVGRIGESVPLIGEQAGQLRFQFAVCNRLCETGKRVAFKTYGVTLFHCSVPASSLQSKCLSRRTPTKVIPDATAKLTARLDGAPMAASIETPERNAF